MISREIGEKMKEFIDIFKNYVSIETTATEEKENCCSNSKILDLSYLLFKELQELKPDEISINKFGIIDAKFNSTSKKDWVCLLAHMDTSNQSSGKNVKVVIEKYLGKDIKLNKDKFLSEKEFPALKRSLNHTIVHTDGTTLLGSDDKSGIAIIMKALMEIKESKQKHRPIEIIFTTDEEIGCDAEHISMELIKSKYGYTVDGGDYEFVSIETFSAYEMIVKIEGKSIHPGSAKNKMVNAARLLFDFDSKLDPKMRPELTEGKEAFYHLIWQEGEVEKAEAYYILRSFDEKEMEMMINNAKKAADEINKKLKYDAIKLTFKREYKNMKEVLDKYPEIQKEIEKVYKEEGLDLKYEATRGGTTGSHLSFKGLPCPNLGTGGYNFHGVYEYLDLDQALKMVKVIKRIIRD